MERRNVRASELLTEAGTIKSNEVLLYAKKLMAVDEIDHHESDLYLKVTEASTALKQKYEHEWSVTRFIDNINHEPWYEFPFCYWENKQ